MIDKKETSVYTEVDLSNIDTGACLKGLTKDVKTWLSEEENIVLLSSFISNLNPFSLEIILMFIRFLFTYFLLQIWLFFS